MSITNEQSGTNVHEIADGIYRINTPVTLEGGVGFSFNQYLLADDEPLLFHTGPRKMFPLVREAVASIIPVERLRYIAFSHVEADECGSLNEWLAVAPHSSPLCGTVAAMVSISDLADRPPRALADGEVLSLGNTPCDGRYAPSAARVGMRFPDGRTDQRRCFAATSLRRVAPIFPRSPSRTSLARAKRSVTRWIISRTPGTPVRCWRDWHPPRPATLACMHGSAWRGDGAQLLRALADALSR